MILETDFEFSFLKLAFDFIFSFLVKMRQALPDVNENGDSTSFSFMAVNTSSFNDLLFFLPGLYQL